MDLRLFDDPKPRWNHLTLPRLPQTLPPPPSTSSSTTASTSLMPSPMTLSKPHARINYSDTTGQPGPILRSMNPSSEEEPLPSKYGMPNRIPMMPKGSNLADRARWRRRQPQAPTLLVEQQQHQQQQQQSVLDQNQEQQPSSSSWLLSHHQNRDTWMLLSNIYMEMDIDGDGSCCTGARTAGGAPIEVNANVAPFPSRSPTLSLFPALSRRTRHQQLLQQQEQQDEQDSGNYHRRHNNNNYNNNSSYSSSSSTTDYGHFHQNRIRQMSLFPGRWQTLGWMSHLLSDLSFRQPRWLHRDEEENDDEDGDNDLKRQVIYNNFRSDDDYCGVCKVDRYQGLQRQQDDTTAAATEVKVQRPNLDNVVNSTLPTKLRHDGNTFDYDHHDEDDEHDYNTHLHAKQRHQFPNRSRFVNNTLFALALLQKTLTRLLTISLSAASALYLLHLIPKCAHDFFIVEILWGLFKTFHWTWYLIAVWPIRSVLWCLAAAVHVLMMLIWPSKTTLVIEFHVVIIYFLRRLRIEMMVKGAK